MARIKQLRIYLPSESESESGHWSDAYDIGLNEDIITEKISNTLNQFNNMGFYRFTKDLTGGTVSEKGTFETVFNNLQENYNYTYSSEQDTFFVFFNGLLLRRVDPVIAATSIEAANAAAEYNIVSIQDGLKITLTNLGIETPAHVFDEQYLEIIVFKSPIPIPPEE